MTRKAPTRSKPPRGPRPATRARSAARAAASAMPTGTLTKKTHSHERASVSRPPSSRPTAPPPPEIAAKAPSALARSGPSGTVVVMMLSAAGETSAAPRPCSARAATRKPGEVARPSSSEASGEQRDADQEQAATAEEVAGAAAEQQEAAEDQHVGVDDPLEVGGGEVQVGLDGGQRDVRDRRVEDHHELREADHDDRHGPVALRGVGVAHERRRWG